MLAMGDEIPAELAWQMGRPVRYGAGELRGFAERARYMIEIAEERAGADRPRAEGRLQTLDRARAAGPRADDRAVELSLSDGRQFGDRAGADGRQRGAAETFRADAARRRAVPARLRRAGLPAGLFQNLALTHEQAAALISSRAVDQVNFTGSVAGGRAIEAAAAGRFLGVGLELGGKDPAYVRADADLAHAIETLVDGAFFNSGQSCCGIERIYVDARVYDDFVDGAVELTRNYVLGDPARRGDDARADGARRGRRASCAGRSPRPSRAGARP